MSLQRFDFLPFLGPNPEKKDKKKNWIFILIATLTALVALLVLIAIGNVYVVHRQRKKAEMRKEKTGPKTDRDERENFAKNFGKKDAKSDSDSLEINKSEESLGIV